MNFMKSCCLHSNLSSFRSENGIEFRDQAPVLQKVDNAIHGINLYPLDNAIGFPNTYLLNSDLSGR